MEYKVYYHRYGSIEYLTERSLDAAKSMMEAIEDDGEGFGDCIVDETGTIVHDFDAQSSVIGRKSPPSRVGEQYTN